MAITLNATARQRVRPGGKVSWVGGIVKHRGHPFIVDCGHRHHTRLEAIECAESLFHADPGSVVADKLSDAVG